MLMYSEEIHRQIKQEIRNNFCDPDYISGHYAAQKFGVSIEGLNKCFKSLEKNMSMEEYRGKMLTYKSDVVDADVDVDAETYLKLLKEIDAKTAVKELVRYYENSYGAIDYAAENRRLKEAIFGASDVVKKETGLEPQEFFDKIIDLVRPKSMLAQKFTRTDVAGLDVNALEAGENPEEELLFHYE